MCDVSVIIPVYNIKEEVLLHCINSVVCQKNINIEIFIIDDGSEDKCAKLCDSLKEKDYRIEVIHQTNQGVSVARNEGMRRAKGKWIAFVDGDDWLEPDMLATMAEYGEKSNADIVLCDCFINYTKRQLVAYFFNEELICLDSTSKDRLMLQFLCPRIYNDGNCVAESGGPWAKLYRNAFIQNRKLCFHKDLRRMQDNVFNLYAYEYAKSISYLHRPLYHYRKSTNSGLYRYNPNIANIYNLVFQEILEYIEIFKKNDLFREALKYRIFFSIYVILNIDIFNKDNPNSVFHKREKILSIINSPYYSEAIRGLKKEHLNQIEKKFFFLVKHKLFFGMYMAVNFRKAVYTIIGRGIQR